MPHEIHAGLLLLAAAVLTLGCTPDPVVVREACPCSDGMTFHHNVLSAPVNAKVVTMKEIHWDEWGVKCEMWSSVKGQGMFACYSMPEAAFNSIQIGDSASCPGGWR